MATGFRAIGFNVVVSFVLMILLHASMSYATSPVSWNHLSII
jgi:hypothetical protein